jgi:hypothetical protein
MTFTLRMDLITLSRMFVAACGGFFANVDITPEYVRLLRRMLTWYGMAR